MKKILIADDRPETRELLRVTLSLEGVLVVEAINGEEALHIALQERPALVLIDLMMPGLDGLEVCRRLKTDARTKDTIVLILTARSQSADRELARQGGADGYIVKPFSPADLLERVRKALGQGPEVNSDKQAPNSRGRELGDLSLPAELRSRLRHELLTPMISLQGFAEILLTRDISEPQKHRYLKIIHQEANRLIELVEEMLSEDD